MSKWTNDSQHLLLEHFDAIRNSPFYIYHSALPFSPSSSWLQKCYSADLSLTVKVVKGALAEWGICSRIVLLGNSTKTLSCWNNTIAVGSKPGDIIILDVTTGSQRAIFSGHTKEVNCLAFSSDGISLVSGSDDCTVKFWDVQTGGVIKTFSGHTGLVSSVSISADCTTIASGSMDMTICLWNTQTGECHHTIKQGGNVSHISFSPTNPQYFISLCDGRFWQWNTNGHQIKSLFDGSCIAFSPDGALLVSCDEDVVTVRNSNSGSILKEFRVHGAQCCCFCPDGRLVAAAVGPGIYIWDIISSSLRPAQTFVGHTRLISSLAFSSPSTLISMSTYKSVKFWKINPLSADPVMTDPESTLVTLPLISSVSLQTRNGIVISSGADGMVKAQDIPVSLCKASFESPVKDYKHRTVWYGDRKVNIWDPENGKFLLQVDLSAYHPLSLRISGDGSKIFYMNKKSIQAWDIWTGVAMGKVEFGGYNGEKLLAMDGSRVWIGMPGVKPDGWDFGIPGSPPVELSTLPTDRLHLNNTKLWDNNHCRIQDMATGRVVFQLPGRFQNHIIEVQWNGQYLAVSFGSGEELILKIHPAFLQ